MLGVPGERHYCLRYSCARCFRKGRRPSRSVQGPCVGGWRSSNAPLPPAMGARDVHQCKAPLFRDKVVEGRWQSATNPPFRPALRFVLACKRSDHRLFLRPRYPCWRGTTSGTPGRQHEGGWLQWPERRVDHLEVMVKGVFWE